MSLGDHLRVDAVRVTARATARRSYVGRRLARRFAAILGGLLMAVASAVGMLIAFIPAVMLLGTMGDDPLADADWAIMGRLGFGWLLAVAVTVSGSIAGSALLRRRRGMVLWLRRFGNKDAMLVVQRALDHIGRSWRVVTLDDSFAEAVGVAVGLRVSTRVFAWLKGAGKNIAPVVASVGKGLTRMCVAGLIASVGWSVYRGTVFDVLATFPTFDSSDVIEARFVTGFVVVLAIEFAFLIVYLAVLFVAMPLTGIWALLGSVGHDVRGAEKDKLRTIRTVSQAHGLADSIAASSGRALAPRLTVVEVDDAVWRETVAAFAERAHAVLIDVSDVTENLMWEVKEVDKLDDIHPVFVARRDAVDDPRLAVMLGARTVLVYTTGVLGRRRFERAVFGELEGTRPLWTFTRAQLRAGMRLSLGLACFGWSLWVGIGMIASLG